MSTSISSALATLFLVSPLALAAGDIDRSKKSADEFVSKGYNFTLKQCNLPETCGGKRAQQKQRKVRITSNDLRVDQRTLSFAGLTVELWYVLEYSPGKRSLEPYKKPEILALTVTGSDWPVMYGLRVGMPRSAVVKKLGDGGGKNECHEYVNEEKQDGVTICYKNDRIKSIQWTPWNDA
jgi:hypothetical protein